MPLQESEEGSGSFIMQCFEDELAEKYDTLLLDASLPACHLCEQGGYHTIKDRKWNVENGDELRRVCVCGFAQFI